MQLPPELMRIPLPALDVLRYMGLHQVEAADKETLAEGTGLSDISTGKAIRGLVTRGYLGMDNYVYFLTEKGRQAIRDLAEYDATRAASGGRTSQAQTVTLELVAVVPASFAPQAPNTIRVGFDGFPGLQSPAQLMLRFSAAGGAVNKQEATFNLTPNQVPAPLTLEVVPDARHDAVRVRIEGIQVMDDDVYVAGGMFFDVPVSAASDVLQAWRGNLTLQA